MDHRNQVSPGGAVNGIAQTADGYLWIGADRGLIRFDGFNFRPVSLLPSPPLRTFPYCNCLRMLAGNCGSVHRAPISYAKKMASLRASDTVQSQSPLCQKIATTEYLVSDIAQGTFRFMEDHVQKLGLASPPVISLAETADGKIGWAHSAMASFFLEAGERPR